MALLHHLLIDAAFEKNKAKFAVGLLSTAMPRIALWMYEKKYGSIIDIGLHEFNVLKMRSKPVKKIDDEDKCSVCLESFAELKDHHKKVMQSQCCGHIVCKNDLLLYIESLKGRNLNKAKHVTCFECNKFPFIVKEVGSDDTSMIRVGSK